MKMKTIMAPFSILHDLLGLQGHPGRPPGSAGGAGGLCPEEEGGLCSMLTGGGEDEDFHSDPIPEMMDTVYSLLSILPRLLWYFLSIDQSSG